MSKYLNEYFHQKPSWAPGNLILGNHDISRVASRFLKDQIDMFNTLLLTTPAIPIIYYGDEIGMKDNRNISWEDTKDMQVCNQPKGYFYSIVNRDTIRTPFQWNNSTSAGFSTSSYPWVAVNENYWELNLENQKYKRGHLSFFRDLLYFRDDNKISSMNITKFTTIDNMLMYALTSYRHEYGYLIVINFHYSGNIFNAFTHNNLLPRNTDISYVLGSHNYKYGNSNEIYEPYESAIFIYKSEFSHTTTPATPTRPENSTEFPITPGHPSSRGNKTVVFSATKTETEYVDGEIDISNFGVYYNNTRVLTG